MLKDYTPLNDEIVASLRAIVGEDGMSQSKAVCQQHGQDESYHYPCPPEIVVFPTSTEQVSAIVKICAKHRIAVIPFGTGTSLEGHIAALYGGVCVDVSRMNAVLTVNADDMDVTVQAGVTRKQLNSYIRDTGLFFPIDPGADASLGGMTATRASGTNAVRYGTMRENVLSVKAVLADGTIITTSRRARKSSTGYDLTRVFVGSEGTLGIICEVTLRLYGIPDAISAAVCAFPSIEAAVNTVISTIQCGIPIARIELLDDVQMDAVNRYSKLNYEVAPTLFFEFHGTSQSVHEQSELVKEIAGEYGGLHFLWTTNQEDRDRLWTARHNAYYAALALRPGCKGFSSDVCVPISRLTECILETKNDLAASPLVATILGHVGDGNFHTLFIFDPENESEIAEAKRLNKRIVERALAMEGTCSGEHGIGYGKMSYMDEEHGDAIIAMRAIKQGLDPQNIMNPGKIIPFEGPQIGGAPKEG